MEISVSNVFGQSVTFIADETWTVLKLKELYAQEFGTSYTNWYFMFNGKFLKDNQLLTFYDIRSGSIIQVTHRQALRMIRPVELRIIYTLKTYRNRRDSDSSTISSSSNSSSSSSSSSTSSSSSSFGNKVFVMYGEASWSLGQVKREFAQVQGIMDWKSLKVISNGISLDEKCTLAEYHFQNYATLHIQKTKRLGGIASIKKYFGTNLGLSISTKI